MTHHEDTANEGMWQRFTGKAKEIWGDLTDDELTQYEGKYDQAVGYLKQKYGESAQSLEDWWNKEGSK